VVKREEGKIEGKESKREKKEKRTREEKRKREEKEKEKEKKERDNICTLRMVACIYIYVHMDATCMYIL